MQATASTQAHRQIIQPAPKNADTPKATKPSAGKYEDPRDDALSSRSTAAGCSRQPSLTSVASERVPSSAVPTNAVSSTRGKKSDSRRSRDAIRQTAALAISQLSADTDNKDAVREAGGLSGILSLTGSPDVVVQLHALAALIKLVVNESNMEILRTTQAIPRIVCLLDSSSRVVAEQATQVIRNFAAKDENRVAVMNAGGVSKLVHLLPTDDCEADDVALVGSVLAALASLAQLRDAQTAVRKTGGTEKVVSLVANSSHESVVERGADCIESLARDAENRQIIMEREGITALMKLLASKNIGWVHAATSALRVLCEDERVRLLMVQQDGLAVLIRLLRHESEDVACKTMDCIGYFATEEQYCATILDYGCVTTFFSFIKADTSVAIRMAAAGCIQMLASDEHSRSVILNSGGVKTIVPLLHPESPVMLRVVAVMTLMNLGTSEIVAETIMNCGGLNALIECMGEPTDDLLQEKSAVALCKLAGNECVQSTIRRAGGIQFVLGVLEFSDSVSAIENGLDLLLTLADTYENRNAITSAGTIGLLLPLLDSPRNSVVERAAALIWIMAQEEGVQVCVSELGGLKLIVELLRRDAPRIRFNAIGALPFLTELDDNVREAFEFGAVPMLVEMLYTQSNVLLLQNVAHTLGNFAMYSPECQSAISDEHGVERIVDVMGLWAERLESRFEMEIEDGSWSTRQDLLAKCCFAVWQISDKNQAVRNAMPGIGGVPILIRFLAPTNEEVLLEMALHAICSLCEDNKELQEQFCANHGLAPLVRLLDHSSADVKHHAVRALHHMLSAGNQCKATRELGAIEKIVQLLGDCC